MAYVITAIALTPADFVGKWESDWFDDSSSAEPLKRKQKCTYFFYPDSTLTVDASLRSTIKFSKKSEHTAFSPSKSIEYTINISYKGRWEMNADTISVYPNQVSAKADVPIDEIKIPSDHPFLSQEAALHKLYSMVLQIAEYSKKGVVDFSIKDIKMSGKGNKRKFSCLDGDSKVKYKLIEEYRPEPEPDTKGTIYPRGIMSAL